jgi:hypothetical protein
MVGSIPRLPANPPRCFRSKAQWDEYRMRVKNNHRNWRNYCTDCMPERRDQMAEQRRCAFPHTTFIVLASGSIIGKRKK